MIFLELFLSFLKIGAFTFGGGYAMLPLIMETVVSKGWMSEEALIDFVAVAESTPGPFAINIATYVGSEMGGFFGAVCATLGVVLPSFVIILIVAKCYEKFRKSKLVSGAMTGLKPVVVGLIGAAILSIGVKALGLSSFAFSLSFGLSLLFSLIILVPCLVMAFKKLHPIFIVLISAGLGIGFGYFEKLLATVIS
ncbi:MAG: chromate transporter [Clostridia bacterium]|nr:chromate transporter [Clostridia bacterium]